MSTNHHTPVADDASLNHTTFNTAAASIDEQIGDMVDGTHNFSNINIDGGALDGVTVGGASAAPGTFTDITANSDIFGPSFHVTMGGTNQNVSSAASPTVEFDVEVFDSDSDFNTGTYTMTPSVEGWYLCIACITWTAAWNAAKLMTVQITATGDGSITATRETGGNVAESLTCYAIVSANGSSDTISVTVINGDSVTRTIDGASYASWFMGWRIQ